MSSNRSLPLLSLALAALLTPFALAAGNGGGNQKQDVQVSLVRPQDAIDSDAKGTLRVRSDGKKPRERFDVKAIRVEGLGTLDLFIEDAVASGVFVLVASLEGEGDELKLSLDTKKGDSLPLDAEMNEDLVGLRVEVRAVDDVVLQGSVPPLDLSKKPVKAKVNVVPPAVDPPSPDMKGTLKMRSKANKGQERLDLKVLNVSFDLGDFHVFMEDAEASGVFVEVGQLEQVGSKPKGRWRVDSKKGQMLPFGVVSVTQLEGRRLQVRDDLDAVHVEGTLPNFP